MITISYDDLNMLLEAKNTGEEILLPGRFHEAPVWITNIDQWNVPGEDLKVSVSFIPRKDPFPTLGEYTYKVINFPDLAESGGKETDPNGKGQNEPGAKFDHGKIRVNLVLGAFCRALWEVCRVGTVGAIKYTPSGWLEVPNGEERYPDAAGRHFLKSFMEEVDEDTGCLHKAQKIWNDLAELELILRERQKKGTWNIPR